MDSSCKKGYYFCNTSQKCKKIPKGHKVKSDGYLVREYVSDWREELQGGISVEPYTKDTKFLEVETVDIIKPKALNASDWRNDLIQVDEKYKYLINGKGDKTAASPNPGPAPVNPKDIPTDPSSPYRPGKSPFGPNKKRIFASYEKDLENMIVEMLEEDIQALYENGFSYEEIAEFYDVKDEFLEEGLVSGAIAGAKIIAKVAPKIAKFVAKRGAKDIKTVSKFVRSPQNWKRANQDFDKLAIPAAKGAKNVANFVKQLPARTYNLGKSFRQFADKGYKALKGGAQKIIEPIQKKGQVDRAKYKKYQDLVNRANRLAKSKAEKAGQIVDVSPKIKSLPPGKENLLNKLRSTMTNIKSKSGSLATVAKDKGSALVSKVKSLAKQAKEKTKQLTGLNPKVTLPSSSTTSKLTTISKKSNLKGIKTAALTTGIVAGGLTSSNRKDKITASDAVSTDKSKDPSTITNDGKKSVDPKKNEVVTKTSTTPKGKTKLVGVNSTWTDRHGNVIAPKAKENKKYKYGRTGSHLTPLEQEAAN